MRGLTDIPGILVGHASDYDAITGCTAILCERGAVAAADLRGAASGTEELDLLDPLNMTPGIHAVVFSGGSAFGLETASGVRRWLEHKGIGFETPHGRVPLVFGAILYDLGIGKATVRPTRESGEIAAGAAGAGAVSEGSVGAGTGATVGKALGMKHAMKSGIGTFTVALDGRYSGVLVSALAAVNAAGDVRDPKTGKIVAGARRSPESMEFADSSALVKAGTPAGFVRGNTTLVAVATNASFSKTEAKRLAQLGSLGMARTISPLNTQADGDLVVALSLGTMSAPIDAVGVAAAEAVEQAILRAVRTAWALGGVPALAARAPEDSRRPGR